MKIKGRVHKFGDDINTDDIIAARYLDSQDPEFLGAHCMENIDPEFVRRMKRNDIIVAGKNFGCGSSREHAPIALKGCGVSLVLAKSFARIFYRNAINIGLPILVLSEVGNIDEGDIIEADLSGGFIRNITKKAHYKSERFPSFMQKIINKGGLLPWVKSREKSK